MNDVARDAVETLTLPNGEVVSIIDYIPGDLRSAWIVDPAQPEPIRHLFTYGRGQPMPGTTGLMVSKAHTNIPRNGDNGLPMDWKMAVQKWRAVVNMPLEQIILDWAGETSVSFHYNQMTVANTTLLDLLMNPQSIGPVHMLHNISYGVTVENLGASAKALHDWLITHHAIDDECIHDARIALNMLATMHPETSFAASLEHVQSTLKQCVRDASTELSMIALNAPSPTLADAVRRIQQKLQTGRKLTAWVHLEGPLKRSVL